MNDRTRDQEPPRSTCWHGEATEAVLRSLNTGAEGLSGDEARRRLEQHGSNQPFQPRRRHPLARLGRQFRDSDGARRPVTVRGPSE